MLASQSARFPLNFNIKFSVHKSNARMRVTSWPQEVFCFFLWTRKIHVVRVAKKEMGSLFVCLFFERSGELTACIWPPKWISCLLKALWCPPFFNMGSKMSHHWFQSACALSSFPLISICSIRWLFVVTKIKVWWNYQVYSSTPFLQSSVANLAIFIARLYWVSFQNLLALFVGVSFLPFSTCSRCFRRGSPPSQAVQSSRSTKGASEKNKPWNWMRGLVSA